MGVNNSLRKLILVREGWYFLGIFWMKLGVFWVWYYGIYIYIVYTFRGIYFIYMLYNYGNLVLLRKHYIYFIYTLCVLWR